MLTDQSQLPDEQQSADEQRMRVMQALLAQQRTQGGGALGALSQIAKAYATQKMTQDRAENRQNASMGMDPVSPAYDDSGYPMPRGPGMAKTNPYEAIQNFFMRGTN